MQQEVDEILEKDDVHWKQRAKTHWFQNGDRNTKFFHMCANQRRKTNHICRVQDEGGRIYTTSDDISRAFTDYYHHLFSTSSPMDVEACVETLDVRVTNVMNEHLAQVFTVKEVSFALSQMAPLKSSGPDGFSVCFYQNYWSTIGDGVCTAILSCLNSGKAFGSINDTFIVLIPKVKNPLWV
jgi:hypothetical protein